jgi:hypothetical protein
MIRDVELLKHLPLFIQEYREIRTIMNAENPEFQTAEDETEIIFNNQFIQSCNLKGIAKFESLMGIVPEPDDTLTSRISRVLTRWNDTVPYTFIVLCQRLDTLCGEGNYEIKRDINNYTMDITTHLELVGQTDELEYMLGYMIPANIAMTVNNKIYLNMTDGTAKLASGITFCNIIEITDSFQENMGIESDSNIAGAVVNTASIEITDNFNENFEIDGDDYIGSNLSLTEIIEGKDE